MNEEQQPIPPASLPADDDLSRRQWLLRLGEMVVLAGVSGLVPESASALLRAAQDIAPAAAALPPGLYDPSPEHLVHALSSAGKKWSPPAGSETDYVQPSTLPYQPQFFSAEEFRVVTRFIEILLGEVDATALSQAAQWFDLWLHSAAGVREAALHLDPMHRALAVAVNGEASVARTGNRRSAVGSARRTCCPSRALTPRTWSRIPATRCSAADCIAHVCRHSRTRKPAAQVLRDRPHRSRPRLLHVGGRAGRTRLQRQRLLRRQSGMRSEVLTIADDDSGHRLLPQFGAYVASRETHCAVFFGCQFRLQ